MGEVGTLEVAHVGTLSIIKRKNRIHTKVFTEIIKNSRCKRDQLSAKMICLLAGGAVGTNCAPLQIRTALNMASTAGLAHALRLTLDDFLVLSWAEENCSIARALDRVGCIHTEYVRNMKNEQKSRMCIQGTGSPLANVPSSDARMGKISPELS